jgi:SAM-dependent MidA family methyltransferase
MLAGMWLSWKEATERALYGEGGFYRRSEWPSAHFRTSVHVSSRFADALLVLLCRVDSGLGMPATVDLVDVGAGGGELLAALVERAPDDLAGRLRAVAVEVRERPAHLDADIQWVETLPDDINGLVVANEWLDNVPVDVVEVAEDGVRLVNVDTETGDERLGGRPSDEDQAWLDRWWPLGSVGERAEIGRPRDVAWADVAGRVRKGAALAIDYGHEMTTRPPFGTLSAYREGRAVTPIPDGSRDICAHVALDSCAEAAGTLTTQREALSALGITGQRPPLDQAKTDPAGYLMRLKEAGEEGELRDPTGLGAFGWILHPVGVCPLRQESGTMPG